MGRKRYPWLLVLLLVAVPCAAAQKAQYLVVEKQARQLTLFRAGEPLKTYRVALGRNPVGPKQYEGDHRTPEGTYTIDFKNPDSDFHRSLKISYPSDEDRARAEHLGRDPGGLIMIHGIGEQYPWRDPETDWTDGCIAVTNEEIEEIWELVDEQTPVVIRP